MNILTGNNIYKFEFPVWKLHLNVNNNLVHAELRTKNTQEVLLQNIDVQYNKSEVVKLNSLIFNWNVKIEIITNQFLICSELTNSNSPVPKSIFIYDFNLNKIVFKRDNFSYGLFFQNGLELVDNQINKYFFDYSGTQILETELIQFKNKINETYFSNPNSIYFSDFRNLILNFKLNEPYNTIEYFESDHVLVLCYNYFDNNVLKYRLIIVSNTGELLYNSPVFSNNNGLIDSTYFIFDNSVIFLEDEFTLRTYKLL